MDLFTPQVPQGLKPNLAGKYDRLKQKFPCFGSYKLDGIRALSVHQVLLSRTLKEIPNGYTQSVFQEAKLAGCDGELCAGPPNHKNVMQRTTSAVMAYAGQPDVTYYLFDKYDMPGAPFYARYEALKALPQMPHVEVLEQVMLHNEAELDAFEAKAIFLGYEGVMTRDPHGVYKFGRSTVNEGGLIKVKRFSHGEAKVVGFEEQMHNGNEEFINELGVVARSTHKANLVSTGMLGAYWVTHPDYETPFKISAGSMTHEQRVWAWEHQNETLEAIARFKWFNHGIKDVPRHGLWDGFRSMLDMDPTHPLYKEQTGPTVLFFPVGE